MIDLTKELPRPIKPQFLERVLDPVEEPTDNLTDEDRQVGSILGSYMSQSDSLPSKKWWEEVDDRGNLLEPCFERGEDLQRIGVAPYYLVKLTIQNIQARGTDELKDYLDNLFKAGCVTSIASLVVHYWGGVEFIANFLQLSVATGVVAVLSKVISNMLTPKEEDYGDIFDSLSDSPLDDIATDPSDPLPHNPPSPSVSEDTEGARLSQLKRQYSEELELVQRVIPLGVARDEFNHRLIDAFEKTSKVRDRYRNSTSRREIVKSLEEYILCNNATFSELTNISKGTVTYNNICFLIYEGLRSVFNSLTYTGQQTMQVRSLTESQLYYRLEVVLPREVKTDTVVSNITSLESKFKAHEADNDVIINVSSYGDSFIFKIMKEITSPITWGDVIRYYDPLVDQKTYLEFTDEEKYDIPVIAGLQNEETPIMFDLAENTSIAIAGTSGSGKSWGVFSLIFNMVIQSHPGDISLIIFDFKRDPQYTAMARLPHVVGLHHTIEDYNDHLREIIAELDRRKEILERLGVSKWSELRKSFKDQPDKLRMFPWLFVVFEEMAAVLSSLETSGKGKEMVEEFILLSKEIAKQGRSLGMRLVLISQRTTANELPRDLISECGVKFTFQLAEADLERVGMLPRGLIPPKRKGSAVFKEEFLKEPVVIRTLGLGGFNDDQIQNLTRMLAFEWHSRIDEKDVEANFPTLKITDNRRQRRDMVMKDLAEGKMIGEDISKKDLASELAGLEGFNFDNTSSAPSTTEPPKPKAKVTASGFKGGSPKGSQTSKENETDQIDLDLAFSDIGDKPKPKEPLTKSDITPMMGGYLNHDK